MAYEINKTDGSTLVTVEDNNLQTVAGITLVGRNRSNYGESFNENLVKLVENFANSSAPTDPIVGQLWWDTSTDLLNVRTNIGWTPIGNAVVSPTEPAAPSSGTFWFDSSSGVQQLKIYDGTIWQTVGPELVGVGGANGIFSENIEGNNVLALRISSLLIAIISATEFSQTTIADFPATIVPGINFRTNGPVAEILTKTVSIEETAILPVVNNVTNLGSSSYKWADVYATTFNGALAGNATTASSTPSATNATNSTNIAITANTDNSAQPLVFVSTTTGNLGARVSNDLTYNPNSSSQTLSVPNISATSLTASGSITGQTLTSTVADGTTPLTVTSTTKVDNLQAATAARWHTTRTFSLTGAVTATGNIDGSGNISLATSMANDAVALGTNTTGNYVASVTGSNGITISGSAGEGWTPGIAIGTTSQIQMGSLGVGTSASATSGEIRATNDITAFYSTSDVRLKENIKRLNPVLPKIDSIGTYNFNYKTRPDQKMLGVIAQELIAQFPELVYETAPVDEGTGLDKIYAVRYELLSVVALQAIKELSNEIAILKKQLAKVVDNE